MHPLVHIHCPPHALVFLSLHTISPTYLSHTIILSYYLCPKRSRPPRQEQVVLVPHIALFDWLYRPTPLQLAKHIAPCPTRLAPIPFRRERLSRLAIFGLFSSRRPFSLVFPFLFISTSSSQPRLLLHLLFFFSISTFFFVWVTASFFQLFNLTVHSLPLAINLPKTLFSPR